MSHRSGAAEYDDDYGTCVETYSTLCIFSDAMSPAVITEGLGIEPTRSFGAGDLHGKLGQLRRKTNGWFLSTKGQSESRDTRRHLDMLLAHLEDKASAVRALQTQGCEFVITSYWVSVGHGGPSLWPHQMSRLGELGIETWWDVYFQSSDQP